MRAQIAEMALAAKAGPVKAVVDASGASVGRLASVLAKRLLQGQTIDVVHAELAVVSGNSTAVKANYQFKIEVGTRRKGPFTPRQPHLLLKRTVRGMLPYQRPRGREALKRLTCHLGVPNELKGTSAEVIELAKAPARSGMTLGEIAAFLGRPVEVMP